MSWNVVRGSAREHPNVVEGREAIPGGPSRAWIEDVEDEYGSDSPYVVARVDARFPETATDSLVRQSWLRQAVERHREGAFEEDRERRYWTLAVDVAGGGPDASVVCLRRGRHVEGFRVLQGEKSADVAREVLDLATELHQGGRTPVARVVVDEVGVGWGVFTSCQDLLPQVWRWEDGGGTRRVKKRRVVVEGFNAGARAKNAARFRNLRAQAFWCVRKRLEGGEIALPDDPRLLRELRQTRTELTADGKTGIESKDRIKARLGGKSPDRADSLSMSFLHELEDPSRTTLSWR